MTEELRNIKVRIAVDTNKGTYELIGDYTDLPTAREAVAEYFDDIEEGL